MINREIGVGSTSSPTELFRSMQPRGRGTTSPTPGTSSAIPSATKLYRRSREVPYPDVVIRQMWPPRVIDSPGGITCEYFGWEESRIPRSMADDFNCYLSGVGVMSTFVADVLRDSGVDIPVRVVGIGVPPHDPDATVEAPELGALRKTRFLHVSSAFPRKGIDVLLQAYFAAFGGSDDVTLILKTFPNPHNEVADQLKKMRAAHPSPPDVRWIDRDLEDDEIMGLYNLAHCYVHPARGEGFGLPVAEAMSAGVPVITLAYSGLADFVSDETATTIAFELEPARTHFEVPDSVWAEPDVGELTDAMRRYYDEPERAEIKQKAARARELIGREILVGRRLRAVGLVHREPGDLRTEPPRRHGVDLEHPLRSRREHPPYRRQRRRIRGFRDLREQRRRAHRSRSGPRGLPHLGEPVGP